MTTLHLPTTWLPLPGSRASDGDGPGGDGPGGDGPGGDGPGGDASGTPCDAVAETRPATARYTNGLLPTNVLPTNVLPAHEILRWGYLPAGAVLLSMSLHALANDPPVLLWTASAMLALSFLATLTGIALEARREHGLRRIVRRAGDRDRPHTLIAVDIVGFGLIEGDDSVHVRVRESLYRILRRSFDEGGVVGWEECHHEDRGDGVLIVVGPGHPPAALVDALVVHLDANLRRHNRRPGDKAGPDIRLRLAAHTGRVTFDDHGLSGRSVVHLYRLLDAPGFKAELAAGSGNLGVITSDALYRNVLRHDNGLIDPGLYRPLKVVSKETRCTAWIHLPRASQTLVEASA